METIQIPYALKFPQTFDTDKLKKELNNFEETDWVGHSNRKGYDGKWMILPFRGPAYAVHPTQKIYCDPACDEFKNYETLDKAPYVKEIMNIFECDLLNVRYMSLLSGSVIKEHSDDELSYDDGIVRLHIPVSTNKFVNFYLNRKKVKMQEGELWYLKLTDPHAVENLSDQDRVHLVIDCKVNDWITEFFIDAIGKQKKSFIQKIFT